jgi:hypothetical protein
MLLTQQFDLQVYLVSLARRRTLVDRQFRFNRTQIPNCLSDIISAVVSTIARQQLTDNEYQRISNWGTKDPDAYLAYLEALSAAAAYRFGVSVPNPRAALECISKATQIDPAFEDAQRLQDMLTKVDGQLATFSPSGTSPGNSEFAYPVKVPHTNVP